MTRVLVIGAGIAGLASAHALSERGAEVTIIDRREQLPATGLGLNLPANAIRALGALGFQQPLREIGEPVLRREYRTASDRMLFDIDEQAFWGDPQSLAVVHGQLLKVLAGDQYVRWRHEVSRMVTSPGQVTVELNESASETFDLVIGADGVRSTTRAAIVDTVPRRSAMTAASWRFVTENPGVGCWTYWSGAKKGLLLIPLRDGQIYGYATSTSSADAGSGPRWLADSFGEFPLPARQALRQAISAVPGPRFDPVEEIRVDSWIRGRVIVVGDAAHATGPVWAQGAAMALEDAVVLAESIGSTDDMDLALKVWETRRRRRVEHVQRETDRMSKLARLPDLLLRVVAPRLGPKGYHRAYQPLRAAP